MSSALEGGLNFRPFMGTDTSTRQERGCPTSVAHPQRHALRDDGHLFGDHPPGTRLLNRLLDGGFEQQLVEIRKVSFGLRPKPREVDLCRRERLRIQETHNFGN